MCLFLKYIMQLGKVLILATLAWCTPPRYWRKVAEIVGRVGRKDKCWPLYREILIPIYSPSDIAIFSRTRRTYSRELKMQILGMSGPWHSWNPPIMLNGEANLIQGLENGSGVILWVTESSFSTLIVKMALSRAKYRISQLSRPAHGFGLAFSFGRQFVNPIWVRVEDRFIAERVLISGETAADALAVLRSRLRQNGIVAITLAPLAHKFVGAPFLGKQLQLPTGPIQLAATTGAVLMPVFAWTTQTGEFVVLIDKPINGVGEASGVSDIAAEYAKRLELFVLAHPDQWCGWDWLGSRIGPSNATESSSHRADF